MTLDNGNGAVLTAPPKAGLGGASCGLCVHWEQPFEDTLTYDLYGLGPKSPVNTWSQCKCPSFPKYLTALLAEPYVESDVKIKTRKIEGTTNLYLTAKSYSCPHMSFKSGDS